MEYRQYAVAPVRAYEHRSRPRPLVMEIEGRLMVRRMEVGWDDAQADTIGTMN